MYYPHNKPINFKIQKQGKSAFIHGNRGRKPAHAISDALIDDIITLYNHKYYDATFSHACELLAENDDIFISPSALTNIMYKNFIVSPRTTRTVRKRLETQLHELHAKSSSKTKTRCLTNCHCGHLSFSLQASQICVFWRNDTNGCSVHLWFGSTKTHLHLAIDDSTGNIVGAYFDTQETLNGYYHVFHQILTTFGIPAMFYTDRRTVFEYKQSKSKNVEKDTFTQFSYACKQLGVEIKTTSIPQAKGRVERAFQTLQQRLPIVLRLAGVETIKEANVFLNSYIKKYNAKFALPINSNKSVFEMQPDLSTIHQTLAVISERTVDSGHCIKFKNQYYKTIDSQGLQVHYLKGTKGLVIQT